jgi:hypothetical protein
MFLRLIDFDISGTGSTTWDFRRIYDLDISGIGAIIKLIDRTIPIEISGTGQMSISLFDWSFSLEILGTSGMSTFLANRTIPLEILGSGGFVNIGGTTAFVHGGIMLDRGAIDRGSSGSGCINCIPPVLVDRTIPLNISGIGSTFLDFCRLYDLSISGIGQTSTPLFDWDFLYEISGIGSIASSVDRSILLDLYGTGKFTAEEWTIIIKLYFESIGVISTPSVVIPVHYLSASINGTSHFWDPALLREITNISALIKGGSIQRSWAEKMFTAKLEFAEREGYDPLSLTPWQKVTFYQPDYTGNFHPVFVGIFPTSHQIATAASMPSSRAESEILTAYDYAWYLSAQYLTNWIDEDGMPHNEQILLTPADQAKQAIHYLAFDHRTTYVFKKGDWVVGSSTNHKGMVVEVHNSTSTTGYIRLTNLIPAGLSYYFVGGEELKVNGNTYAWADGHSLNETGTIYIMYPENYIKELLGGGTISAGTLGDYWRYTTGIYPYRMNNITGAWSLMPAIEFPFTLQTTKSQAIEKICKYCKSVFYVKWRSDIPGFVGAYTPCAYLVKQSEIDSLSSGLDLPEAVYLTYGGSWLSSDLGKFIKGTIEADFKGEEQYNWVSIRCQDLNGLWLESHIIPGTTCGLSVYDPVENPTGTEIKRMYYEEDSEISTQSDLDAKADNIYAYYHYQINTWKATFYKRSDLELLQRVIVSGFGTSVINDGTYRIIDIQYDYGDGGAKNEVTVTLILDSQFVAYLDLKRVFYNSIYEIQNVINNILDADGGNLFGVVTEKTLGTNYVKFSVTLNGTITKYYTGFDPIGTLAVGNKILAVQDSKGQYICAKLG